jgi:DNA-binding response OmpR family regulator
MSKRKINNTVLIIEDEMPLQKVLKEKLTYEGFIVSQAFNGEEGLKAAIQDRPDLILLDILMPIMDGNVMLKKLRTDAWGKNAKVILITNLNEKSMIDEATENGALDYIVKSDWKIADVVKKIKNALK